MAITYKTLNNIHYPAFKLPSDDWELKDGLLYLEGMLLDDINMPGKTLGIRRMQTPFKSLFPLKKSYDSPIAIIKESSGWYIDYTGKLFEYKKTKFCKLRYYRIKRIEKKITHSILKLHNINFPIKIPRPPPEEYKWAGVLLLDNFPWLLYGYSKVRLKDTRRKV
jgi:hypothetical protein